MLRITAVLVGIMALVLIAIVKAQRPDLVPPPRNAPAVRHLSQVLETPLHRPKIGDRETGARLEQKPFRPLEQATSGPSHEVAAFLPSEAGEKRMNVLRLHIGSISKPRT